MQVDRKTSSLWPGRVAAAACAVLALLPAFPLHAQLGLLKKKKTEEVSVPAPQPQNVSVLRGENAKIRLKAFSGSPFQLEFIIREQPKHGRLSSIRYFKDSPLEAEVLYSPPGSREIESDAFTFAAKRPGGRVSAAVPINVTLVDPKPLLELAQNVGFESVIPGGVSMSTIKVSNVGTGPYKGVVILPDPWLVAPGRADLILADGESTQLPIGFHPTKTGHYEHELKFGIGKGESIILSANCYAPFALESVDLKLAWDPAARKRAGSVKLTSSARKPLTILVRSQGGLLAADKIVVEAGTTVEIPVEGPPTLEAAGDAALFFEHDGYRVRLDVVVDPVPGRLAVIIPKDGKKLDLGEVKPDGTISAAVRVLNTGGAPVQVYTTVQKPFVIVEDDREFPLPGGKSRDIHIEVLPGQAGTVAKTLEIRGEKQTLKLALSAKFLQAESTGLAISGTPGTPGGASAVSGDPRPTTGPAASIGSISRKVGDRDLGILLDGATPTRPLPYQFTVPRVVSIAFSKRSRRELHLKWMSPGASTDFNYLLETRQMIYEPDTRRIKALWVPLKNFKIRKEGREVHARVSGLDPGTEYLYRVITMSPDKKFSYPSPYFGAQTLARPKGRIWLWLAIVAVLVIGVGVVAKNAAHSRQRWLKRLANRAPQPAGRTKPKVKRKGKKRAPAHTASK